MEKEKHSESKSLKGSESIFTSSTFFGKGIGNWSGSNFFVAKGEPMDEEPLIVQKSKISSSVRSTTTTRKGSSIDIPRQSFDSNFPPTKYEMDLKNLHQNHIIIKKETSGHISSKNSVYKCIDLEDKKIKALKVIPFKCKSS